ncbi:hypothetical protein [Archangium lipolyticum]|uniref:hypothetical protein n=1 Tax=Archangium lipolyticum TaxID=2970465 RepID=UPI002149DC3E|nr:hypothetical protein [Archangium lipolyticum]
MEPPLLSSLRTAHAPAVDDATVCRARNRRGTLLVLRKRQSRRTATTITFFFVLKHLQGIASQHKLEEHNIPYELTVSTSKSRAHISTENLCDDIHEQVCCFFSASS